MLIAYEHMNYEGIKALKTKEKLLQKNNAYLSGKFLIRSYLNSMLIKVLLTANKRDRSLKLNV